MAIKNKCGDILRPFGIFTSNTSTSHIVLRGESHEEAIIIERQNELSNSLRNPEGVEDLYNEEMGSTTKGVSKDQAPAPQGSSKKPSLRQSINVLNTSFSLLPVAVRISLSTSY